MQSNTPQPRAIKIRGWNLNTKRMIAPSEIGSMPTDTGGSVLGNNTGTIYLQWTGLLDKNGKEIYEGDIVKWIHGELDKNDMGISQICFSYGCFRVGEEFYDYAMDALFSSIEIIGNIYENPELLK